MAGDLKSIEAIIAGTTDAARKDAATAACKAVQSAGGVNTNQAKDLVNALIAAIGDKKDNAAREAAIVAAPVFLEVLGKTAEPFAAPLLSAVLVEASEPKVASIRAAADKSAKALINVSAWGFGSLLPALFDRIQSKEKHQTRILALQLIGQLAEKYNVQFAQLLPLIIPPLCVEAGDARPDVSQAAEATIEKACITMNNKDLTPFIPALVSCLARPQEIPECVHKLSSTTFVQSVESPTLAVVVPVLERGLRERASRTIRQAAIITDNMCKLVEKPVYAKPLLPTLLPLLEEARIQTSDPEVRSVCERAYATLCRAAGESASFTVNASVEVDHHNDPDHIKVDLVNAIKAVDPKVAEDKWADYAIEYVAYAAATAIKKFNFEPESWTNEIGTVFLTPFLGKDKAASIVDTLRTQRAQELEEAPEDDDDDEGEDLCNCDFSLAYGGKILLNQARLHLKRGHRYGLCGANGCGKSTLMRAIANGQLEGFPTHLKTANVEHDLDGSLSDLHVVDYLIAALAKEGITVTPEAAAQQLRDFDFAETMINGPIASLSGGWKMKLALSRAVLLSPQILLLDEPTNHLDVKNVAWLVDFLVNKCHDVSCLIVSHDSGFLDKVCTDIIHYQTFKLKRYRGNLSAFVKIYPEAAAYYSLDACAFKFKFPEPGFLEGVNTKGKAILRATNISYYYPGREGQYIFQNTNVVCSLSSRVGVIGPNGAGKSTLIKVITGENAPITGTVWKHPSVRIAYVAQHAFHHLEEHLDKTPNEYIQWRFASGDDKEAQDKATRKLNDEDEAELAKQVNIDGSKSVVEQVINRRKYKSTMEYEVTFVGLGPDKNKWLPRKWLEENGYGKLVDQLDAREAAAAGLHAVPLTATNIAKHLAEIGLESEFTLHHRMRGLSGGQKVKVVIAAATWMRPHLIVLDEPTNYLDRDSLGALAGALKDFGGGVVIISHAGEFINATTTEKWIVGGGEVKIEGETWSVSKAEIAKAQQADEVVDAAGNVIKVKKELTEAEKKKAEKEKAKRAKEKAKARKRGEDVSDDEIDWDSLKA